MDAKIDEHKKEKFFSHDEAASALSQRIFKDILNFYGTIFKII